jgi:hypothetical protein
MSEAFLLFDCSAAGDKPEKKHISPFNFASISCWFPFSFRLNTFSIWGPSSQCLTLWPGFEQGASKIPHRPGTGQVHQLERTDCYLQHNCFFHGPCEMRSTSQDEFAIRYPPKERLAKISKLFGRSATLIILPIMNCQMIRAIWVKGFRRVLK